MTGLGAHANASEVLLEPSDGRNALFPSELIDAAILRAPVDDATSQLQARDDRCLFCLAHLFAREGAHARTP
jgi:hypothetical protein